MPGLLKRLPEAEGINDLKDLVATHHLEALEVRDGWFWVEDGVVDGFMIFCFKKCRRGTRKVLGETV